ncbi:MAG TPA: ANTAR domain-containing protein [Streptosporangiaceae bacterium]
MAQSLLEADGVTDVLARVETAAREFLPAADLIGVTIRRPDGGCEFPVDVDEEARSMDLVQYETGDGPCVEVTEPGGPACVACPDLTTAGGWPALAAEATERGYPAMVAVGVKSAGTGTPPFAGAISGYARHGAALDEPAQDAALLLGTHASLAVAAARAADVGRHEAANLRAALGNRDTIGQAKGVLMERYVLTPRQAFDALSAVSQHLNVKVAEVAAVIADGHGAGGNAQRGPAGAMDAGIRRPRIGVPHTPGALDGKRAQEAGARRPEPAATGPQGGTVDPVPAADLPTVDPVPAAEPVPVAEPIVVPDPVGAPAGLTKDPTGDQTRRAALTSAATNDRLADQLELQAARQPAQRLFHLAHAAYRRGLAARDRTRAAALAGSRSTPPR